jgi:hypothetical protein
MTFHRIPMVTRVAPTLEQIAQFMSIVTNPAHQPVYVHCAGGKHRTGVMTAVYRMEHDGWTADQAYQEMKRYKFGWSIWHPELKDFVYHYQPLRKCASTTSDQDGTLSIRDSDQFEVIGHLIDEPERSGSTLGLTACARRSRAPMAGTGSPVRRGCRRTEADRGWPVVVRSTDGGDHYEVSRDRVSHIGRRPCGRHTRTS